jgi:DNA polymerase-3 subunit epsilon
VLDRALSDYQLSEDEARELEGIAKELGLVREQAETVHRRYLRDLVQAALADGAISYKEMSDLETVAGLLAINRGELLNILRDSGYRFTELRQEPVPPVVYECSFRGKSVCFTGTFSCELVGGEGGRESAERIARERGLIVKSGVAKSLNMLVAADVKTQSTKAKKARNYGITILSEQEYWRLMGFDTKG